MMFLNSEIKKRNISILVIKRRLETTDVRYSLKYNQVLSHFDCLEYSNNWIICKIKDDFRFSKAI